MLIPHEQLRERREAAFREFVFEALSGRVFELMTLLAETSVLPRIEARAGRCSPSGVRLGCVQMTQARIAADLGTARARWCSACCAPSSRRAHHHVTRPRAAPPPDAVAARVHAAIARGSSGRTPPIWASPSRNAAALTGSWLGENGRVAAPRNRKTHPCPTETDGEASWSGVTPLKDAFEQLRPRRPPSVTSVARSCSTSP